MARSWLRIDLTWISLVPVRLHANCSTVTTLLSQRHASWQHVISTPVFLSFKLSVSLFLCVFKVFLVLLLKGLNSTLQVIFK